MFIEAKPSQPFCPYLPLQTCTVPATIEQRLLDVPATALRFIT
jgi:hypothetical protein